MLKIKSLSLKNFKSIGSNTQTIEFAPITLLFGPNGAGKSTIIQALAFLNEVINHRNYDPIKTEIGGDAMDLGGFLNLVHKREKDRSIEIGISFEVDNELKKSYDLRMKEYPSKIGDELPSETLFEYDVIRYDDCLEKINTLHTEFEIYWDNEKNQAYIKQYSLKINDIIFCNIISDNLKTKINYLDLEHELFGTLNFKSLKKLDLCSDELELVQDKFSHFFIALTDIPFVPFYKQANIDDYPELPNKTLFEGNRPYEKYTMAELEKLTYNFVFSVNPENRTSIHQKFITQIENELELRYESGIKFTELSKILRLCKNDTWLEFEIKQGKESLMHSLVNQPDMVINLNEQSDALPISRELVFDKNFWGKEGSYNSLIQQFILNSFIQTLFVEPISLLSQLLKEFVYIGPLRDLPPREIKPQQAYDKSQWSKGLEAWNALYKNEGDIVDQVNQWMGKDHINTGYKVKAEHDYSLSNNEIDNLLSMEPVEAPEEREKLKSKFPFKTKLSLKDLNNNIPVMLQDIGVGISQLLPIIVLSCHNNDSEKVTQLVAIEQPELHIHPALQVELADLFIESSINNNKIFLIETHSEHLMLRLLRRIRETTEERVPEKLGLKKEEVSIIYVEPNELGTFYSSLHSDEYGGFIERWPKGFFSERIKELM